MGIIINSELGRVAESADAPRAKFFAEGVKSADTQRSGRCERKLVGVQISPSAHTKQRVE